MLLLLASLALADPTTALAPTVGEIRKELDVLDGRLVDADALGEAVARVHNAWAERSGGPGRTLGCDHPAADLALRSELFGTPWRDAVQLARVALDDVERGFAAPTAAPLLDDGDRSRLATYRDRTARHERALAQASSWHQQHLAGFLRRCKPTLAPAPGLDRTELVADGESERRSVAVAVVAGTRLCGEDDLAVDGPAVVVLDVAMACYGDCGCPLVPVAPAAVLGDTKLP